MSSGHHHVLNLLSAERLRNLYFQRSLEDPTAGNRTKLNLAVTVSLLTVLLFTIVGVEVVAADAMVYAGDTPVRIGYIARHIVAIFALIIFLFVDGSPETLGLGVFLGFESLARSTDWGWLPGVHSPLLIHTAFGMGDVFRLYFCLQLARVIPKSTVPWFIVGFFASLPFGLAYAFVPGFEVAYGDSLSDWRNVIVGTLGSLVCVRTAWVIRKHRLPWRVSALILGAVASFENVVNSLPFGFTTFPTLAEWFGWSIFAAYRCIAYYLFGISTFINISTIENRIRSLSTARAKEKIEEIKQKQKIYEAIAKTTQMLAHDVRKPFTMLKAGIEMLDRAESVAEMQDLLKRLTPDISRAVVAVDGMLSDVMNIGSPMKIQAEQTTPEAVIEKVLMDAFRMYPRDNVTFRYDFAHYSDLQVDVIKVSRALINIIENAIQAVEKGPMTLTLTTRNVKISNRHMVELSIHNTGSTIAPDDLERIFDVFYTKGKRGGTGLGLAVVKKIVESHGGDITCQSSADAGTVFCLTIPAAIAAKSPDKGRLPRSSSEIRQMWQRYEKAAPRYIKVDQRPSDQRVANMAATLHAKQRKINILLIDDEHIYLSALLEHTNSLGDLSVQLDVKVMNAYDPLRLEMDVKQFDLIICDVDLGPHSLDGFETVADLRRRESAAYISIHSNRNIEGHYKSANSVGADSFLPKPMSRVDFLNLVAEVIDRVVPRVDRETSKFPKPLAATARVVLIEDDIFMAEAVTAYMDDADLRVFRSPDEFWQELDRVPDFLDEVSAVITDQYFEGTNSTGTDLAAKLKERASVPVVLFTNSLALTNADRPIGIDLVIHKELLRWEDIASRLAMQDSA